MHARIHADPEKAELGVAEGGACAAHERDRSHDVITDFAAGGAEQDSIVFDHSIFASFADVMAHSYQDGANAVIQANSGNVIALIGVQLSSLYEGNFLFS